MKSINNNSSSIKQLDSQYVIHNRHSSSKLAHETVWVRGKGSLVWNDANEEYIDAMAGLINVHLGHGREDVAQAAYDQMKTLAFMPNETAILHATAEPVAKLAQVLVNHANNSGMVRINGAYFCCGGAEANEAAIHTALRYWEMKGIKSKRKIICFNNAYHGCTFAASSMTMKTRQMYGFERVMLQNDSKSDNVTSDKMILRVDFPAEETAKNFKRLDSNESTIHACIRELKELIQKEGAENIAMFLFEPIQGNGGNYLPDLNYYGLAKQICRDNKILMVADEVLTFGKTGAYFCMSHFGVEPDIITIGKGVSSGYSPLSAMLVADYIRELVMPSSSTAISPNVDLTWTHCYTYSGHLVSCAVALKVMQLYEEEHANERAKVISNTFKHRLRQELGLLEPDTSSTSQESPFEQSRSNKQLKGEEATTTSTKPVLVVEEGKARRVKEVRGLGIMISVEFSAENNEEGIGTSVATEMFKRHHVICQVIGKERNILLFVPPLSTTDEQMIQIARAVKESINSSSAS